MALQQVGSFNGIIEDEQAVVIASIDRAIKQLGFVISTLVIRSITFYNPDTSPAPFQLRKRIKDDLGDNGERFLRDDDSEIKSFIPWKFGNLGGIKVLDDRDHYYDIIMDSAPPAESPIEYIVVFGYSL